MGKIKIPKIIIELPEIEIEVPHLDDELLKELDNIPLLDEVLEKIEE